MQIEMIEPAVAGNTAPFDTDDRVPMVVMAQAGDPPGEKVEVELVDRAEISNGTSLVKLSKSEQLVADLRAEHAKMAYSMATTKEATATRAFRARCVALRSSVAAHCLMLRRPAIDFGKKVIDAEAPLIAEIKAIEKVSDEIIKADEKRRADEKAKAAREEAARKALIDEAVEEIRSRIEVCINQSASFIADTIQWIDDSEVTEEDYGDRTGEVLALKLATRAKLVSMREAAEVQERTAAEQKARDDQLAADRAALEQRETAFARREAVAARIDEIRKLSGQHVESDSATLEQAISTLVVDAEWFGDRFDEAAAAAVTALQELRELHGAALEDETAAAEADALALAEAPPPAPPTPPPPAVAAPAPEPEPEPDFSAPAPAPAPAARGTYTRIRTQRPSDDALIGALALHYRVHESTVIQWLQDMDLTAAARRIAQLADEGLPF